MFEWREQKGVILGSLILLVLGYGYLSFTSYNAEFEYSHVSSYQVEQLHSQVRAGDHGTYNRALVEDEHGKKIWVGIPSEHNLISGSSIDVKILIHPDDGHRRYEFYRETKRKVK